MPPATRCSVGKLSRNRMDPTRRRIAKPAKTTKINLHVSYAKICPPTNGAITGAKPLTIINDASNLIRAGPDAWSRAIALEITTPKEPVTPCKNRPNKSTSIFGA